jgi:colanic acid/amylovoran biosynthesis glycosyltransferase
MKRLAYLLADFPVLSETFVGDEIRAMRKQGHDVEVVMMRRSKGPAQPADELLADAATELCSLRTGLQVSDLRVLGGVRPALSFIRDQKRLPRRSLAYQALRLARHFNRTGVEHVHAHFAGGAAAHAIAAARLAGITCSFVCHGHDVYAEPEDLEVKLANADQVVAVCQDIADDLKTICASARISLVPCGVSPDKFSPALNGNHNDRLIFIGRLVEQKGISDILHALARIAQSARPKLDIVGQGPLEETLQKEVVRLGLKGWVSFLGRQTSDWFAANGPNYRALIAPFKTAPDGARDTGPIVIKEAMSMGVPVISTRYMGVKEMVTNQTGWLSEPGDPVQLADNILKACRMGKETRLAMGREARSRVETFFTLQYSSSRLSRIFETAHGA